MDPGAPQITLTASQTSRHPPQLTPSGIPYLALVLLALDLSATAILLWQVPSPAQLKKSMSDNVTGTGSSSGLSRRQPVSEL